MPGRSVLGETKTLENLFNAPPLSKVICEWLTSELYWITHRDQRDIFAQPIGRKYKRLLEHIKQIVWSWHPYDPDMKYVIREISNSINKMPELKRKLPQVRRIAINIQTLKLILNGHQ